MASVAERFTIRDMNANSKEDQSTQDDYRTIRSIGAEPIRRQTLKVIERSMCNLYSITKGPQAIRDFARAMRDKTGNLPPIPGVFPNYAAPIVCSAGWRTRAHDGPLGHAAAEVRRRGPKFRFWRHERPQRLLAALATMARRLNPMRRAAHQLPRK
jgi:hypothetical protein